MIWVWGENGPDAALESALTPAQLVPDLNDEEGLKSGRVNPANVVQNDLQYGWDTFMENILVGCDVCVCVYVRVFVKLFYPDASLIMAKAMVRSYMLGNKNDCIRWSRD